MRWMGVEGIAEQKLSSMSSRLYQDYTQRFKTARVFHHKYNLKKKKSYSPCFYTRRDCRRILIFLHGLLSSKNRRIPIKIKFREPPLPPQKKPILTGKWQKVVHFCDWNPGYDSRWSGGDV